MLVFLHNTCADRASHESVVSDITGPTVDEAFGVQKKGGKPGQWLCVALVIFAIIAGTKLNLQFNCQVYAFYSLTAINLHASHDSLYLLELHAVVYTYRTCSNYLHNYYHTV